MPMLVDDGTISADAKHLQWDPSITWEESIRWLREHTRMEIWLKGSMYHIQPITVSRFANKCSV